MARALRGLLYVLWDLSQVDPSDLSALFAGPGRLRIGFSELDPAPGTDPDDDDVQAAVQRCWDNLFCNFSEPVGTSLICIQGPWSNVADAKIKSGLAAQASTRRLAAIQSAVRASLSDAPKPWGVTALFAEHTGNHPPIDVDWSLEQETWNESARMLVVDLEQPPAELEVEPRRVEPDIADSFDQAAAIALFPTERASNKPDVRKFLGPRAGDQPLRSRRARDRAERRRATIVRVDPTELRKLLGTVWFRSVFPRLSIAWRERLLDGAGRSTSSCRITCCKLGRREIALRDIGLAELKELFSKSSVSEAVGATSICSWRSAICGDRKASARVSVRRRAARHAEMSSKLS